MFQTTNQLQYPHTHISKKKNNCFTRQCHHFWEPERANKGHQLKEGNQSKHFFLTLKDKDKSWKFRFFKPTITIVLCYVVYDFLVFPYVFPVYSSCFSKFSTSAAARIVSELLRPCCWHRGYYVCILNAHCITMYNIYIYWYIYIDIYIYILYILINLSTIVTCVIVIATWHLFSGNF